MTAKTDSELRAVSKHEKYYISGADLFLSVSLFLCFFNEIRKVVV